MMASVLMVSPMPIGDQRAGPGIRFLELARVLASDSAVTLLLPDDSNCDHPAFDVRPKSEGLLEKLLDTHEIVIVQGPALQEHPDLLSRLGRGKHYVIVDLYDPITLELLEVDRAGQIGRWVRREYTALLNEQLRLGDFFVCATERQRDYWIGALSSLGRINHDTYDGLEFRNLIDVVPFGLPAEAPQACGPVFKGVLPGIGPSDRVILWGGGLWDWLDPITPVRAMQRIAAQHRDARLIFFEWEHHPAKHLEARRLADELALLDSHVFFTPWLPPERWGSCLLEADIGLVFHPASIETHFAFRTRLLDYVWAGLPIVTASGDVISQLVAARGLGQVVTPGDEDGLVDALDSLLDEANPRASRRARFRSLAESLVWERVARPLVDYCRQPRHAGDKATGFAENWEEAKRERRRSDAAHAERLRLEAARHKELSGTKVPTTQEPPTRTRERARSHSGRLLVGWRDRVRQALRAVRSKDSTNSVSPRMESAEKRNSHDGP